MSAGAIAIPNNVFKLHNGFNIAKSEGEDNDACITIEGYASTDDIDRHGDIIPPNAWNKQALANYRKNPIVLAYHSRRQPVGKTVDITVDEKGLYVKVEVLKDTEVGRLVEAGILKTFSVGFRLLDFDYNPTADAWVIKKLELYEISIVSIPANQEATFDLAKQLAEMGEEGQLFLKSVKEKFKSTTMSGEKQPWYKNMFGDKSKEEVKDGLKKMSDEIDALKGEKESLETKNSTLASEKSELEKTKQNLEQEVAKLKQDLEDATTKHTSELENKNEEITTLKADRDAIQAKLDKTKGLKTKVEGEDDPELVPATKTKNEKAYENNESYFGK